MNDIIITGNYLIEHPDHIFVFGDNRDRVGYGGAAKLRDFPNTYGFVTVDRLIPCPQNPKPRFSYTVDEYLPVYKEEINLLREKIIQNPTQTFLISRLGAGIANQYGIFEAVINPRIKKDLNDLPNVKFLF